MDTSLGQKSTGFRERFPPCKPNLSKAEKNAIQELKGEKNYMILTVDKGQALMVMDRQDYFTKAHNVIKQPTYRFVPNDTTNKHKARLIHILKKT